MSRKLLDVKHHLSSGCCMWSGIEDVYATRSGEVLPAAFFFALSGYGESVYLKMNDPQKPYMFGVADGRTRTVYDRIKDMIGLDYQISEGRTLEYALTSIRKEIDHGNPVILGPLDMFYLPYLNMYHIYHIPIHYVLMVGYDDDKDCVLIYDCDREALQELPQAELIHAWQVKKNVIGDKNGFIKFSLPQAPIDKYHIADLCLHKKSERQLCAKPDFVGVNAFYKIAQEFPQWQEKFSAEEYRNVLASMTESFGTVPKLPNEILGSPAKEDISFQGNYNRLSNVLLQLGTEYNRDDWMQSGTLFGQCGLMIEEITKHIIRFYCHKEACLAELPDLFIQIGKRSKEAYQLIANNNGGI